MPFRNATEEDVRTLVVHLGAGAPRPVSPRLVSVAGMLMTPAALEKLREHQRVKREARL